MKEKSTKYDVGVIVARFQVHNLTETHIDLCVPLFPQSAAVCCQPRMAIENHVQSKSLFDFDLLRIVHAIAESKRGFHPSPLKSHPESNRAM